MKSVYYEASHFIKRWRESENDYCGRLATDEEIRNLKAAFKETLPEWYVILLKELPLINLEIGWNYDESSDGQEDDEVQLVDMYSPAMMIEESFEAYPGIPILEKGYVCIGGDPTGSGDPYFVNFADEDAPVYQVFHDVGDTAEEILEHGLCKVAESLEAFFRKGIIVPL